MKRKARLHTLLKSESGVAIMSVVLMASAIMIVLFLAPTVFKAANQQSGFSRSKFNLQTEALQMRALLKYRTHCKRVFTQLAQIEGMPNSMGTQKTRTFPRKSVSAAIQTPGSPLSKWEAPGPWTVNFGNLLFSDRNAYRASLQLEHETELGITAPKPEEIPLYIGFAADGSVDFCEATSMSTAGDNMTFEDKVCALNSTAGSPQVYDPVTMLCRN